MLGEQISSVGPIHKYTAVTSKSHMLHMGKFKQKSAWSYTFNDSIRVVMYREHVQKYI